jgi:hypothetical protein
VKLIILLGRKELEKLHQLKKKYYNQKEEEDSLRYQDKKLYHSKLLRDRKDLEYIIFS